jgi:phosphoglycolate phosphatase
VKSHVLLFDLDGTLTDPKLGIVRCLRHALDGLARDCPSDDVLATFIGPPLRGTFSTLLESEDKGLIEKAMSLYRERFAETGIYENQLYEGVTDMLRSLKHAASALFVATSKPAVFAERIVKHFGIDHHFAGIYGPDLDGRLDSKTDLLAHLLATERIPAASAVMVGDRAADIVAAKANGIRSIGALWGYGSKAELSDAGADLFCQAPQELVSCLSDMAS